MRLLTPTVGPIIGYTTQQETRIWMRGEFQNAGGEPRRCFGAARVRPLGPGSRYGPAKIVKLVPHFDMTGICVIQGLKPDTEYEYQAGYYFSDRELEEQAVLEGEWPARPTATFRTSPADLTVERSYVAGSCRYLLQLLGGIFTIFDDRGDKLFRSVLEQIADGRRLDALIMMGDQIYADDLNIVAPSRDVAQFLKRYRETFTQKHLQHLMAQVPTYMILDDHEIENDWPRQATAKDRLTLYPAAIHSYQIYQCSHSPVFRVDPNGRITGTPDRFWYSFQDGGCKWFVLDTRTERIWHDDPNKRQLIKDNQMQALKSFLANGSGLVKIVVSSVPLFPDLKSESDDKWSGFPRQRGEVLDFIRTKQVRKVVFISGDVHCSLMATMTARGSDPDFQIVSVVSSSFFWPYPHTKPSDFSLLDTLTYDGVDYDINTISNVVDEDNFTRIDIKPDRLKVTVYARKGNQLGDAVEVPL